MLFSSLVRILAFGARGPWFVSRPNFIFLPCVYSFASLLRTLFVRMWCIVCCQISQICIKLPCARAWLIILITHEYHFQHFFLQIGLKYPFLFCAGVNSCVIRRGALDNARIRPFFAIIRSLIHTIKMFQKHGWPRTRSWLGRFFFHNVSYPQLISSLAGYLVWILIPSLARKRTSCSVIHQKGLSCKWAKLHLGITILSHI